MKIFEAIYVIHKHQIKGSQGLRQFGQRVDDINELTSADKLDARGKRVRDDLERDGLQALAVLEEPIADPLAEARQAMQDAGLDWNSAGTYVAILRQLSSETQVLRSLKDSDPAKVRYQRMVDRTASRLPQCLSESA